MTALTNTYHIAINIRPEVAFAYVSDLTRHPEWSGGRLRIEAATPGPAAVGQLYHSHGDIPGQKDRPNELRITEVQPPRRFVFTARDPAFGDVLHEFIFQPRDGGTLLERRVTVTLPAIKAFAFRIFIQPLIGKPMMDKSMAALKRNLEDNAK